MRMLVVSHIPAFAGQSPGVIRWDEAWLADLNAQTRAMNHLGYELIIMAPLQPSLSTKYLSKRSVAEVKLSDAPFVFVPLPAYQTATQFLTVRSLIREQFTARIGEVDVVQIGPGGHPVSLGQTVWPILRKTRVRKVIQFHSDPIPAWGKYAASGRNPAKRLAKRLAVRKLEAFCRQAVLRSDLVIAHHPSVRSRFESVWSDHCHTIFTTGLSESIIGVPRRPDPTRPMIVFAEGFAYPTRGLDHLIRAVAKARRLTAKIELYLTGDLQNAPDLIELIRHEKIESHVRLLGPIPKHLYPTFLDQADLLVATPLISFFDPTFHLAQARGLPMVTYQTGLPEEQRLGHGNGLVVPKGDVAMLARVLIDLSRDRAKLAHMSEKAIEQSRAWSLEQAHHTKARLIHQFFCGS